MGWTQAVPTTCSVLTPVQVHTTQSVLWTNRNNQQLMSCIIKWFSHSYPNSWFQFCFYSKILKQPIELSNCYPNNGEIKRITSLFLVIIGTQWHPPNKPLEGRKKRLCPDSAVHAYSHQTQCPSHGNSEQTFTNPPAKCGEQPTTGQPHYCCPWSEDTQTPLPEPQSWNRSQFNLFQAPEDADL